LFHPSDYDAQFNIAKFIERINGKMGMMDKMMEGMGGMMESMFSNMSGEEMGNMMHEMMPNMMESCFSKMNDEQREGMLKMCREMLDKIENKYAAQEA